MIVRKDDLQGEQTIGLLLDHHQDMFNHSPPEAVHALDLDGLRSPVMTFWSAWIDDDIAGCGGLKALSEVAGEIKAMRTVQRHLRKGVAVSILKVIIEEAKSRGYQSISLETGSQQAFVPARKMYEANGFVECGPFADYKLDPNSVFMTLKL